MSRRSPTGGDASSRGEIQMKPTAGIGVFMAVAMLLTLELAGAGASLAANMRAGTSDLCFGYALCR